MANRTVFVIFRWDATDQPELLSGWSTEEKAEGALSKLQSEAPESLFFILPKNLISVDGSE